MRPLVGWYIRHNSFTSVVLPAPFSPTIATTVPGFEVQIHVFEHEPLGSGISERHVLEVDSVCETLGHRRVGMLHERCGVIFKPGQADRAVQPDAAQESDFADRRANIRREPGPRGQHQQHVAGVALSTDATNTTAAT